MAYYKDVEFLKEAMPGLVEVGGKGRIWDDLGQIGRDLASSELSPVTPENLPGRLGGAPDEVSYGPLSVQTRRAAEVLGYDPENLTEGQRDEVIAAAKDPPAVLLLAAIARFLWIDIAYPVNEQATAPTTPRTYAGARMMNRRSYTTCQRRPP
ncbi:hypothetical protein GCM10011581_08310 [Saccharopolyspora subtropica]|uniref:Uncharacterized protein n=1 Tax=Saccharopolyspora thermophila TaxID=89367 RepID=A0A917JNF4_9PSEU|nr:hypothetical protein [Saccharopolyspora subtropica]GGI73652.1 hypothetical protein GCM10011581_08310 [Saccharopolyspora subtropica]